MNVLQNITAIFRSPEAAALAAQGLQASETAARLGAMQLQQDVARRGHQVQASDELVEAQGVGKRPQALDGELKHKRARERPSTALGAEAPQPRHRLDITV
jgi:hypothetical protein